MKIIHELYEGIQVSGGGPLKSHSGISKDMNIDLHAVTVNNLFYAENELYIEGDAKIVLKMCKNFIKIIETTAQHYIDSGELDPNWLDKKEDK